ncbi:2603_t:CDS:1, partial [Gigaspora rosea]
INSISKNTKLLDPIDDNYSNNLYKEFLIECNNEELLDYLNNEETVAKWMMKK